MNSKHIVFATFAYHAHKADSSNSLIYGNLEICLREGAFYFVSKKWSDVNKYSSKQFHNINIKRDNK